MAASVELREDEILKWEDLLNNLRRADDIVLGSEEVLNVPESTASQKNYDDVYDDVLAQLGFSSTGPPGTQHSMMSPDSGYGDESATPLSPSSCLPTLEIIEQPDSIYNFRYLKESKKPHGALRSCKCTEEKRKYSNGPRVKLRNFNGNAIVRVWLYGGHGEPSPNRLVKSCGDNKNPTLVDEPHDIYISKTKQHVASFDNLNILHGVSDEIEDQKKYLRKKRYLPSKKGSKFLGVQEFPKIANNDPELKEVKKHLKKVEKDTCKLYFELFVEIDGQYIYIDSVLSSQINNKKSPKTNIPYIAKCSHIEGPCEGGTEILIFTDKLVKGIQIVFQDETNWTAFAEFNPDTDIHKQVGVAFRTPPYKCAEIGRAVNVKFYIVRTTDGATSKACKFRYLPSEDDMLDYLPPAKRKLIRNPMLSEAAALSKPDENLSLLDELMETPTLESDSQSDCPGLSSLEAELDSGPLEDFRGLPRVYQDLDMDCSTSKKNSRMASSILRVEMAEDYENMPFIQGDFFISNSGPSRFWTDFQTSPEVKAEALWKLVQGICSGNDDDALDKILPADSWINSKFGGKTLLHYAVIHCRDRILLKLLRANADPYALDSSNSNSAIHLATLAEEKILIILLPFIEHPKLIFNRDGDDPLLFAVKKQRAYAVKLLLKANFDPNVHNLKNGETPLHVAIKNNQFDIVADLLANKADTSELNYAKQTPLHYSVLTQNFDLVKKILQFSNPQDFHYDDVDDTDANHLISQISTLSKDARITKALEKFFQTQRASGEDDSIWRKLPMKTFLITAIATGLISWLIKNIK